MNRFPVNHGIWLAVTIIAFAAGSFLARSAKSVDESETLESPVRGRNGVVSGARQGLSKPTPPGPAAGETAAGELGTSGTGDGAIRGQSADERFVQNLVRNAIKEANPILRRKAFDRVLASLNSENVLVIRAAMAEHGATGDQWRLLDYAWGAMDSAGAIANLSEVPERYRDGFLGNILAGWGSKDPRGAIDYVGGLEAGERRERMTGRLLEGLADHDIGVATDYLFRLADDGNTNASRHIDALSREALRTEGLAGARSWAERLPDGGLKAAALDRVAHEFVADDPQAAARWASQYARDEVTWRVIEEVGDEWAERDPASAVAWLERLPEGKGQTEGMRSALGEWARRDPVAAGEYLVEMPDSPTRDAAVGGFSRMLVWKDPETAMQWAESITSKGARNSTLVQVGQAWTRRDRAAATTWAENSGLPEKMQKAIMSPPHGRR